MKKIDFDDLISQKEAAELRQVSRSAISDLVKRNRLEVIEVGGKKFLSKKEVLAFEGQQGKKIVEDKPTGKPAKAKK